MNEHEYEPVRGLPGRLPAGETILWQGSPRWQGLARRVFHLGPLSLYFGALIAWRVGSGLLDAEPPAQIAATVVVPLLLALAALGLLALLAWLTARTTVYTVTSERVVMRLGVVLSVTFNIPFRCIASAGLRAHADGTGDLPLALAGTDRISYLHLWPHARPWRVAKPEPMLRAVPDADRVADILARAILASQGSAVRPAARAAAPARAAPAGEPASLATAR